MKESWQRANSDHDLRRRQLKRLSSGFPGWSRTGKSLGQGSAKSDATATGELPTTVAEMIGAGQYLSLDPCQTAPSGCHPVGVLMGHKVPLEGTFVEYEQGQDSFNNHLERKGRKSRIVLLFPQVSVLVTLPSEFRATMQLMLCHKSTRRTLRSIGSIGPPVLEVRVALCQQEQYQHGLRFQISHQDVDWIMLHALDT
jgi:hypothetical protein